MADAPAAAAAEIAGVAAAAVAVIDIAAAAGIADAAAGIAVDHDTAANCRDILCSPRPRRGMGHPQCSQDTAAAIAGENSLTAAVGRLQPVMLIITINAKCRT
jgi:hypothetical protein